LRPSIVVGGSDDGTAPLLENWYGFFKTVWRLREVSRHGNYTDENGIRIARGYRLQPAVSIGELDTIELNMVLSQTAAALTALPACGRTYNLTHPKPVNFRDLIHASFEALDLPNVTLVEDKGGWTLSPVKLAVRCLVHRELDHSYLLHATRFESRNL
jgi:hypothetical protein